ncbi:hypothetical protein PC123_g17600 [Phytophthora cactorum]|nr:hypothetical protein PC120_g12453 [Phytophthora cactorum]KAG4047036.1 hypothetical protein PC123_g17600 [Phytophthora cactorum]
MLQIHSLVAHEQEEQCFGLMTGLWQRYQVKDTGTPDQFLDMKAHDEWHYRNRTLSDCKDAIQTGVCEGGLLFLASVSRLRREKTAWDAAKYLLRHLSATKGLWLKVQPTSDDFVVATDADWANDRVDQKSVSGCVVYLFGCPVTWMAEKQTIVSKSSKAAEYVAANAGGHVIAGEVLQMALPLKMVMDSQTARQRLQRSGLSDT